MQETKPSLDDRITDAKARTPRLLPTSNNSDEGNNLGEREHIPNSIQKE